MAIEHSVVPDSKSALALAPFRFWWLLIIAVSIGIWALAIKAFALVVELF